MKFFMLFFILYPINTLADGESTNPKNSNGTFTVKTDLKLHNGLWESKKERVTLRTTGYGKTTNSTEDVFCRIINHDIDRDLIIKKNAVLKLVPEKGSIDFNETWILLHEKTNIEFTFECGYRVGGGVWLGISGGIKTLEKFAGDYFIFDIIKTAPILIE